METIISGRDLWGLQIGKHGGNSDKRIFVGKEEWHIFDFCDYNYSGEYFLVLDL